MLTLSLYNEATAHLAAIAIDSARYTTVVRNELFELRLNKQTQRYFLHTTNSTIAVCADTASAVYNAVVRHAVRLAQRVSMRASVYVLRSDVRALLRESAVSEFAH